MKTSATLSKRDVSVAAFSFERFGLVWLRNCLEIGRLGFSASITYVNCLGLFKLDSKLWEVLKHVVVQELHGEIEDTLTRIVEKKRWRLTPIVDESELDSGIIMEVLDDG